MAVCDYLYVSGLRVESGQAVVLLDGKRLRVVRNGKGASRTTLASENPPSDGEITLKDLQARLKASGAKTATVQVATPDGSFDATLDPARAMGRKGRTGDYAAAFAGMDPASREIAARYQLRTLPYGEENASVAKARLAEVLRHVDVSACTTFLPPQFGKYAPADTVRTALDAAAPADALRFAAAAMTDDEFATAADAAPLEALRHGLGRLATMGRDRVLSLAAQAVSAAPGDTFAVLEAVGSTLNGKQKRTLVNTALRDTENLAELAAAVLHRPLTDAEITGGSWEGYAYRHLVESHAAVLLEQGHASLTEKQFLDLAERAPRYALEHFTDRIPAAALFDVATGALDAALGFAAPRLTAEQRFKLAKMSPDIAFGHSALFSPDELWQLACWDPVAARRHLEVFSDEQRARIEKMPTPTGSRAAYGSSSDGGSSQLSSLGASAISWS